MNQRIESAQNRIIKEVKGLKLKKNRDKGNVFVAEGLRFVSEIPLGWDVEYFLASDSFCNEESIESYCDRAQTYITSDELFALVSDTQTPQGILAVCQKQKEDIRELFELKIPFFILAEELNDPGNLGTIIRTADACGADGILLSKGSVDLYNPKVLRSTMGAVFHVPIIQGVELSEVIADMKKQEIAVYAAHLDGAEYPYALPLKDGCAFLIGNEARGLQEETARMCTKLIKIPMPGQAESLNASVAAGVLMYEVVRQRLES